MKILHIITGLGDGGAELTLFKICKYDNNNKHIVISLTDRGKYFSLLNRSGIKVYCLNMNFYSISKFFFLIKLIGSIKPNIVQTWLVHADFLGGIAARLAGISKIIWNVRYSNIEIGKSKLSTILILKILSKLSYSIPLLIIIVSKKAKKIYKIKGYDNRKLKFIPNGYDLSILKINKTQKNTFKKKIKIKKQVPIIGNVARYDPQKDHLNLLKALSLIKQKNINFCCVLVGSNVNRSNIDLISKIKKFRLHNHVKLLGRNDDISRVMNGFDVHILSSSYGEGFPNVIAESMACGTPCITTDVGDAAFIVGKTGWVVPPKNEVKLSLAIEKALNEIGTTDWVKRSNKARQFIQKKFSINKMLKSYNRVWISVFKK